MTGLLEKIKSLDKKILIGAGAGIAALIVAVVLILVFTLGGKDTEADKQDDKTKVEQNDDKDKEEDKDKEDESKDEEKATFTVKVVDEEGTAVAGVVVQLCKEECVPTTTDETGVAIFNVEITEGYKLSVVTCPEGYEYTGGEVALEAGITEYELKIQKKAEEGAGDGTTNSSNGGTTVVELPKTETDEGEINGNGTKEYPYELMAEESGVYTTLSIPAGTEKYYAIPRVSNKILTINNANAYVIESDNTRHDASGGKVSFKVESAPGSNYIIFRIGNKGSSATTFTIQFTNPTGSSENPTIIKSISEINNGCYLSLEAGNDQGHFYRYIVEKDGIIRFYISSYKSSTSGASGTINVDKVLPNNVVKQTNFDASPVKEEKDEQGNVLYTYIEVDVKANEELRISVVSRSTSKRTPNPAADITWVAKYN